MIGACADALGAWNRFAFVTPASLAIASFSIAAVLAASLGIVAADAQTRRCCTRFVCYCDDPTEQGVAPRPSSAVSEARLQAPACECVRFV